MKHNVFHSLFTPANWDAGLTPPTAHVISACLVTVARYEAVKSHQSDLAWLSDICDCFVSPLRCSFKWRCGTLSDHVSLHSNTNWEVFQFGCKGDMFKIRIYIYNINKQTNACITFNVSRVRISSLSVIALSVVCNRGKGEVLDRGAWCQEAWRSRVIWASSAARAPHGSGDTAVQCLRRTKSQVAGMVESLRDEWTEPDCQCPCRQVLLQRGLGFTVNGDTRSCKAVSNGKTGALVLLPTSDSYTSG